MTVESKSSCVVSFTGTNEQIMERFVTGTHSRDHHYRFFIVPIIRRCLHQVFEHMKNYNDLLKKIHGFLKPEGKLFVHIFTHKDYAYQFEEYVMSFRSVVLAFELFELLFKRHLIHPNILFEPCFDWSLAFLFLTSDILYVGFHK